MASAARLSPGSVFAGDFQVLDQLAEGGMGTLYRAEQLSTRKTRVLKLLHARLATDPKSRERFVREATVGAAIDSEHIVEVIAAGIDEASERPWLAMELLHGADLGSLVQHRGPLSAVEMFVVLRQLCHGLTAAHRAGVVHRDLKPANIFIARARRSGTPFTVKILDFGIAKVVEAEKSGATDTETVGSPMWMAPEQLNAQRPVPATDIWALGLIAFWLLTGEHYWKAAHVKDSRVQALFVEQLFKEIEPASVRAAEYGVQGSIPEGFDGWFAACLQREPSERLLDASAAFAALERALGISPRAEEAATLLPDEVIPPSATQVAPLAHGTTVVQDADDSQTHAQTSTPKSASLEPTLAAENLAADLSREQLPGEVPVAPPQSRPVGLFVATALAVLAILGGAVWWAITGGPFGDKDPVERTLAGGDDASVDPDPVPDGDDGTPPQPLKSPPTTPPQIPPPLPPPLAVDPPNAIELVVPLREQPSFVAHELTFLGWSADSRRFVVKASYLDREDEEPLELVQVHDAVTGAMVESYGTARAGRIRTRRRGDLRRLAEQAESSEAYDARTETLKLVEPAPSSTPPEGVTIETVLDEEAPAGTEFAVRTVPKGLSFDWSGFVNPIPEDADRKRAPSMVTTLRKDGFAWPLLSIRPPFKYSELAARIDAEQPEVRLTGRVYYHWSPDARRVVIVAVGRPKPSPREDPMRNGRWFLRAVGPQIRVVEAGAGQQVAREVARQLEAAGLPTAQVSLREPLVAHSEIYFRKEIAGAEALAKDIDAAIEKELPIEGISDDGWSTAVVLLGQDLAP